jgi:hypothetical protein
MLLRKKMELYLFSRSWENSGEEENIISVTPYII